MAQFDPITHIENLVGKLSPSDGTVMRRKTFRHPTSGKVIKRGPHEAFHREPRDFKKTPRKPAEEAQFSKWTAACQEASRISHDPSHPRYNELRQRWLRQLDGHPDPLTGKSLITPFGCFINSVLMHE